MSKLKSKLKKLVSNLRAEFSCQPIVVEEQVLERRSDRILQSAREISLVIGNCSVVAIVPFIVNALLAGSMPLRLDPSTVMGKVALGIILLLALVYMLFAFVYLPRRVFRLREAMTQVVMIEVLELAIVTTIMISERLKYDSAAEFEAQFLWFFSIVRTCWILALVTLGVLTLIMKMKEPEPPEQQPESGEEH